MAQHKSIKEVRAVLALIKNSAGKILLQLRNDPVFAKAHGRWDFPGGGIDGTESSEQAIIRECQEEIGCQVKPIRLLPLDWTNLWQDPDGQTVKVFLNCFECEILQGSPRPANEEVAQVGWFSQQEIANMDTLPGIKEFVALYKHAKL